MKQLIKFEFSKLLKKKLVFIALGAFALIYATMLWSWIFGNEWAVTQEGEQIYGTEAERYNTEIANRFAGPLTDEKVQEILAAFPRTDGITTGDVSNNTYYPVANLFAERDGTWNGKTVQEVFPEFDEPPVIGMSSRWESFLYSMMYIVLMSGILVVIIVSPVFSDEYTSGMDALILTSRYGKKRCVLAKVISAFCFSITMEAVILLVGFLLFAAGRGLEGWNTDIQLSELMVFSRIAQPLKCYEAALLTAFLAMMSTITVTGLTLLFSVLCPTSFVSIILAAVTYLAPMFLNPGSQTARRILMLFPVNSISVSGVMSVGGFTAGSLTIPLLAAVGGVAVVMAAAGTGGCRYIFSRHQVC